MEDIVPELLERIEKSFKEKTGKSEIIKVLMAKLKEGTATYKEANEFSIKIGEILSECFKEHISGDILPDGKMYFNIADRILNSTLGNNHELISLYTETVQQNLNNLAGIHIKPQKTDINQDRIDGIINRVSSEDNFDDVKWILQEPVVNFSQSVVDDILKNNVDFHYRSGLKPKIVRKSTGHCCKWCDKLEGVYDYKEAPKDVYRRHSHCRCMVEYDPGTGKRQNVHTKKMIDPEKDDKIEKRKQSNIQVKDINRKDDSRQFESYVEILGEDKMPHSLSEFQKLKYENPEEYEKLKDRVFIKRNFKNGTWKDGINFDKQARHIQSTAGNNRSYFYDDIDVEKLYNKHKMTGKVIVNKNGRTNKELINLHNENIGIDIYSGKDANGFTIHYGKTGAHIVPVHYEEE